MNQQSQTASENTKTQRVGTIFTVAALFFLASLSTQAQQSGSLADAARQARTQKQAVSPADVSRAQQVADELSEEENSGDAPAGFKTYNAGDYKVWVPAPYAVDGHDEGGVVLSGPNLGNKRSVVLLGTPLVFAWGGGDAAFHDAAVQFASTYLTSAKCTKTTVASHEAFQCGLVGATMLGRRVSGNAMFVHVSDRIYPILCATSTDSTQSDIINGPHSTNDNKLYARNTLDREEQEVRAVWQKCETVFQSIRVVEGRTALALAQPTGASGAPSPSSSTKPAEAASSAGGGQATAAAGPASLADIARHLHDAPGQPVAAGAPEAVVATSTPTTTVPEGFKVHAFQYCSAPRTCWNASVLVPVDAKLISSGCNQYAFEVKLQGSSFVLMAGSAGAECGGNGPDLVRWHQLVDPENKRAPGTYSTISSQVAKIDDKPATITTLAFRKGLTDWMGKRADIENNGAEVVVGCMAPRDNFADGDAVCSALIGSIRLP